MLAPAAVVLAVVFVVPILYSIWQGLEQGSGTGTVQFVGLANFAALAGRPAFWEALRVSLVFTVACVALSLAVGLGVALAVYRKVRAANLVQGASVIPWAMPYVAAALLWTTIFDYQYGPLNWLLKSLHLVGGPVGWLTSPGLALVSVVLVQSWELFPLAGVMFLAGLQAIPPERLDAAAVDGANVFQQLRYVLLPGVRPVSTILTLLLSIWVFGRSFTVIFVLTGGGPVNATQTLVIETYEQGFELFDINGAAALGTIILAISGLLSITYWRVALRGGEA
jgi:multiple sugar transport system permease protein